MGRMGIRPHTMGLDCLVARELEKMPKECGTTDRHASCKDAYKGPQSPGSFCREQACAVCQEQAVLTLLDLSLPFDT